MRIRPCIDIHNGKVKQIVGGTLRDADGRTEENSRASENFVAENDAAHYARIYKRLGLSGGHIILLNAVKEERAYRADRMQAFSALRAFPGGMQAGGGGRKENSSTNRTDTEAAHPDMAGMSQDGSADTGTEQAAPDMSAMNQNGSADAGTGQIPSDTAQGEMAGGPMQVQQEQSQEEEDQADETQTAAEPLDAGTWGILGGCTVLLLAGIIIVKFYKRH